MKLQAPLVLVEYRVEPTILEFEGRFVERQRHVLRFALPNGDILDTVIAPTEAHKVRELAEEYGVEIQESEPLPEKRCSVCLVLWQGHGNTCPSCGADYTSPEEAE